MAVKKKSAPAKAPARRSAAKAVPAQSAAPAPANPARPKNKAPLILALVVLAVAGLVAEGYYTARAKAALQKEFLHFGPIVQPTIPSTHSINGDKAGDMVRLNGTDRTWKLQEFDSNMQLKAEYKPQGAAQQLVKAVKADTAADGSVYILQADGTVKMLDPKLRYIGQFPTHMNDVTAVDVDPQGHILVASRSDNKVEVFNAQGAKLTEFGGPNSPSGALAGPWRMEVLPDGRVVIAESIAEGLRVRVLAADYKPIKSFIIPTEQLRTFELTGMGVDNQDRVYFNDAPGPNGIVIYNLKNGDLIGYGRTTKDGQQIVAPGHVGANKWTGDVYVDFIPGVAKCRLP